MTVAELRNEWALVTGASCGLGAEFSRQLAAAGTNLALVARRRDRLEALARDLRETFGVDCIVCQADLTDPGALAHLRETLADRGVAIRLLCNNAGVGWWGAFEDAPLGDLNQMMQVNVAAVVNLCHTFLPQLLSHSSSAIINVASQAAYQPVPYMAVYAATKAFIHSFSQALHGEWRDRGVHVMSFVPGPTESEFEERAGGRIPAIKRRSQPPAVVAAALRKLSSRKPVVSNLRSLWQQRLFAALAPPGVVIAAVRKMFRPPSPAPRPRADLRD